MNGTTKPKIKLSPRSKKPKLTLKNAPPEIQRALKERNNQAHKQLISSRKPFATPPNMGGNNKDDWVKVDDRGRSSSPLGADFVFWKNKETGEVTYEYPADTIAYYLHTDQSVTSDDTIGSVSAKLEKSSFSRHYIKFSSIFDLPSPSSPFKRNKKENAPVSNEKSKNSSNEHCTNVSTNNNKNVFSGFGGSKISFLRSLFRTHQEESSSSTASFFSISSASTSPLPSTDTICNNNKGDYSSDENNSKGMCDEEKDEEEGGVVYNNTHTLAIVNINNPVGANTFASTTITTTTTTATVISV